MTHRSLTAGILVVALATSACQTTRSDGSTQDNQGGAMIATLLGAAAGALIGSKVGDGRGTTMAMVLGGIAGAYLANTLYTKLSQQDQNTHLEHREYALRQVPDGKSINWSNPDSGAAGRIGPVATYENNAGEGCRDIEEVIVVDGQEQTIKSSHCWDESDQRFYES